MFRNGIGRRRGGAGGRGARGCQVGPELARPRGRVEPSAAKTWWTHVGGVVALAAVAALAGCGGESGGWTAVEVGAPAPEFAAARLTGDTLSLAEMKGEAVLLNVWATWCPPCREEMPGLQALHDRYGERGLNVVGVSVDSRGSEAAIRAFVTEHDITFDILHDASDVVSRRFRTQGVPETFLIDREGVIVKRWIGKFDPLEPAVLAEVEAVLEA